MLKCSSQIFPLLEIIMLSFVLLAISAAGIGGYIPPRLALYILLIMPALWSSPLYGQVYGQADFGDSTSQEPAQDGSSQDSDPQDSDISTQNSEVAFATEQIPLPDSFQSNPPSRTSIAIWQSHSMDELHEIETQLVKQLNQLPYNPLTHYHLCLYYLKLYTLSQLDHTKQHMLSQANYLTRALHMAKQTHFLHPQSVLGYLAFAQISYVVGDYKKAKTLLLRIHDRMPTPHGESYFLWSRVLALNALESHTKPQPQFQPKFKPKFKQEQDQTLIFLKTIASDPHIHTDAFLFLAEPILTHASISKHLHVIEMLSNTEQHSAAVFLLAIAQKRQQAHKESITTLHRAISLGLQNQDAHLAYIATLIAETPQKALKMLDELPKNSKTNHPLLHWEIFKLKGLAYQHMDQPLQANSHLLRALIKLNKVYPGKTHQALERLYSYHQEHNLQSALTTLLHTIKEQLPHLTNTHNMLGTLYSNEPQKAIVHLQNALALEKDSAYAHNRLGLAYYQLGHYSKAKNEFSTATTLSPGDATHHYNIACVHALLGETKEALEKLKIALKLNPKLQELASKDQDLKALHQEHDFRSLVFSKPLTPSN